MRTPTSVNRRTLQLQTRRTTATLVRASATPHAATLIGAVTLVCSTPPKTQWQCISRLASVVASPVAGSVAAVSACQSLNKPCLHLTISSLALSACSASLRPGRSGSSCSRAITVPSKNSTEERFRKFTATRLTATGLEGVVGCLAGLSWRVGLDTSQDCLLSRRGTNWEPR